jgi:SAM-dependent methyltransferase
MNGQETNEDLDRARRQWTALGADDPLWAVLSHRGRSGGRWDVEEFLHSGTLEIDAVLQRLRSLDIAPDHGTALDFGCGAGRLTQALGAALGSAIGVDVSEPMLEQARSLNRQGDRCRFVLNTEPDLRAIEDGSVDLVYCCRVLQHMAPALARSYVAEFFRIVRAGAPVVFQVPTHPSSSPKGLALRILPPAVATRLR